MPNILLVQPFASTIGGVDSYILELVRTSRRIRRDYTFAVVLPPGSPYIAAYEAAGAEVEVVAVSAFAKTRSPAAFLRMVARFPISFAAIRRIINRRQIDLVHSHKINVLVADAAARATGTPAVHTFHEVNTGRLWIYRLFSRVIALLADEIIVTCDASGDLIGDSWRTNARVRKIYAAVDVEHLASSSRAGREAFRAELGFSRETRVVTALSRMQDTKGIEFFVDAAAIVLKQYPHVQFLMVGDVAGPEPELARYKQSLHELVARHGIAGAFRFVGIRRDVADVYKATDVFVLPSVFDILPATVFEAMSMSLPIVATRVGGVPEQVDDGVTGYLVPPRNAAALAGRIGALLADPQKAEEMGQAGRARVERFFTSDAYARATLQLYEQVINRRRVPRASEQPRNAPIGAGE